jgi:carbonic anhydrase
LNPDYLIVLHHSGCGGYATLGADVETEIRRHMVEYGGFRAKVIVDAYLKDNDIQLGGAEAERLLVEEGCRMQVHAMISFLSIQYPRLYEGIRQEKIKLLPLVYDTVSGRVFKVPERLEGSHSSKRHEL